MKLIAQIACGVFLGMVALDHATRFLYPLEADWIEWAKQQRDAHQ